MTPQPTPAEWNDRGILHKREGRLEEAIAAFQQAVTADPAFAHAHYNLGNAYRAKNQLEAAAQCFRRAVESDPAHAHALAALGQTLHALERHEEAAGFLRRALVLIPDDAGLHCDLGDALQSLRQYPEALAQYRQAVELDPRLPRAWYSAGCTERARNEYAAAIACFRNALELVPGWCEARHNLGQALFEMGQVEDALVQFGQAAAGSRPELPRAMIAVIIPGAPNAGNQAILDARRAFAEHVLPQPPRLPLPAPHDGPPRIGYVSSFFHRANWMKPVWALLNHHDRAQFQIHLFSDAPATAVGPEYRPHPEDRFHKIADLSNQSAAERIAQAGIDVLVDLNGYSSLRRLPLFTLRPAPVIVGWFNMYATTGMPCYDCLVGDSVVLPAEEEKFYCERILRVPGTYLPFEVGYPVPDVAPAPFLANHAITFGCLASQYKITSQVVDAWSRILHQVPRSSLLLKNAALGSSGNRQFLCRLFEQAGIPAARVRLEGPASHFEFLETYGRIDLALDTFPYNGGTTTTEALWQGVPVIAFWGDRWVSRTSASILRAANLGQFVAGGASGKSAGAANGATTAAMSAGASGESAGAANGSETGAISAGASAESAVSANGATTGAMSASASGGVDGYVSLAAGLANSPAMMENLIDLRSRMRSHLRASAACDAAGFARNMERLYREAHLGRHTNELEHQ